MHAYGDGTLRRVFVATSTNPERVLMQLDVKQAMQLQVQLGVAIGEAVGQLKMDLVHDEQGECIACESPRWPNG